MDSANQGGKEEIISSLSTPMKKVLSRRKLYIAEDS